MSRRSGGTGGAWRGRLRQFAIYILLLAVGALALQAPAHASPAGHSVYAELVTLSTGHCAGHHQHDAQASAGCLSKAGSQPLADCCQACLTAAVPVAPPTLGAAATGDVFGVVRPDRCERTPEGILRPPRPAAA